MDWESYYRDTEWKRGAYLAGHEVMAGLADRFLDRTEPGDVADFGCGPASVLFDLAKRHPEIGFHGFDAAETVVAANIEGAAEEGIENLFFAVDSLPDVDTTRRFDVVYCMAVLYFVADAEAALDALFDRVRPGGHLVVSYPNRVTREVSREFDEEKREAFSLVYEGENLLTAEDVERVLGADAENYWELTDGEEHEREKWPIAVATK